MEPTSQDSQKRLLEAALFMSSEPMKLEDMSRIVGINSLGFLKQMLSQLRDEYAARGFQLVERQEGWQFQVRNELLPKVASLTPYSDMPEGVKRCLALIAYKEPVTQSEIIRVQGNKSYEYVKYLSKKGLVRAEKEGRTKTLTLTQEFERYFGDTKEKIREQLIAKLSHREKGADVSSPAVQPAAAPAPAEKAAEKKAAEKPGKPVNAAANVVADAKAPAKAAGKPSTN